MKNTSVLAALAAMMITSWSMGQTNPSTTNYIRNSYVLQRMASPAMLQTGSIQGMAPPPPETVGDVYLYPNYRKTTFLLFEEEKLVEGYKAKYDIQRNEFDLLTQQGVRVLPGKLVKSLVWLDSATSLPQYLFNYQEFKNRDEVPYLGFFQLLADGHAPLLKKMELVMKKADYSPTLNTGHRENRYIKKPHYFIIANGHIDEIESKNQLIELLSDKKAEVNDFIKKNAINVKSEGHLVALFEYYNSLHQ